MKQKITMMLLYIGDYTGSPALG